MVNDWCDDVNFDEVIDDNASVTGALAMEVTALLGELLTEDIRLQLRKILVACDSVNPSNAQLVSKITSAIATFYDDNFKNHDAETKAKLIEVVLHHRFDMQSLANAPAAPSPSLPTLIKLPPPKGVPLDVLISTLEALRTFPTGKLIRRSDITTTTEQSYLTHFLNWAFTHCLLKRHAKTRGRFIVMDRAKFVDIDHIRDPQ